MVVTPGMKMDKRFKNRVMGRYDRYTFETGVADKPHRMPKEPRVLKSGKLGKTPKLGSLEGGPVRKTVRQTKSTNLKIAIKNQRKYKFMTAPFQKRTSKDLRAFIKAFFNLAAGKIKKKSDVAKLVLAVVRNPILRGDYGRNTMITRQIKGFNRLMIDTGQMFKSLRAYVRSRRVQK